VLPSGGRLRLTPVLDYPQDRALLSLDGQTNLSLSAGAKLEIQISDIPAQLIFPPGKNFFTVLSRKLNWGQHAD
jgi:NAD kinase